MKILFNDALIRDNIAQVKTLCNVVQEAPENIAQGKLLFNVVLILLGQYRTDKNLCNVAQKAPDEIAREKNPSQCRLNRSLYGNFCFGLVNF